MPVTNDNLRRIGDFADVGIYAYKTNDTKAALETAGYFDLAVAAGFLEKGALLMVAGDLDGTPWHSSYTIASNDGTHATLTEAASVTQNSHQVIQATLAVLGTAETKYVVCPVAGSISKVLGVCNANGATADAAVTITVPTTGAIAALPFTSAYVAGTAVEDTSITAHTLAAGAVVTVATDGGGTGAGAVVVTLLVTPT